MKIGLVCPYNFFRGGGVQTLVKEYYTELSKRGHEVKIITPHVNGHEAPKDVIMIGMSTEWNVYKTQQTASIHGWSRKDIDLKDFLEKEQFDILHFHEPWIPLLPMQLLVASNTINVATFHGTSPDDGITNMLNKLATPHLKSAFSKLHRVYTVSNSPMKLIREVYDGPVEILPNGINLDEFKPSGNLIKKYTDEKITILFLNRLEERKGAIYLIKAFEKLKEKHSAIRLVIAGKGKKRKMLETYVEEHGIADVEFLGFVSEEEKLRLFESCDIYCSPAPFGESFGIVLLEAMAFGKPIVAGENPGYASVLRGRGSLFLVDPTDTELFATKLRILIEDETMRNSLGDWGLKEVQQYNYPTIIDRVEELYKEAIENPGKIRTRVNWYLRFLRGFSKVTSFLINQPKIILSKIMFWK